MRGLELLVGFLLIGLGLISFLLARPERAWIPGWGLWRAMPVALHRREWRALFVGFSFLTLSLGYGLILYPYFVSPSSPRPAPTPHTLALSPTASPTPLPSPGVPRSPEPLPFTPSPVRSPTPASPTPSPLACEPGVLQTIERANAAQEAYIQGQGTLEELATAWGDAALEARRQGDRLRQAAQAIRATIQTIEWEIRSCALSARPGPDLIEVQTEETWIYRASMVCPPGQNVTVERVVTYPREIYRLAVQGTGWRIIRWSPGEGTLQRDWRCP
ncbi:MAG TPA: hypothetical protein VNK89_10590 [Thermoflexus sp.]|nr:hypothetical protein [Thermoflexus sp.]